ncbi:SRPBCC domain-containing protein [Streptomyces sp. NPDC005209]|uniref:SRPBCC domain-containing protein n=1 Tax=Streptomyces sp. NPDC005209 TaxID=3156715 RepID=UPI0033A03580
MSTPATATATVEVACDPATAFDVFTADIGRWWKRGTRYWNEPDKAQELRFEPQVGGRLVEVNDLDSGEGFEIGRVLVWEPGQRLVFTWRQGDWDASATTDVEVRFESVEGGTRVTVEHGGWDRVPSAGTGVAEGYGHGWAELLGFYAEKAGAR